MIDFNEMELSRDRTVAAILAHATVWYERTVGVGNADARAAIDAEYQYWITQVRQDRGVHTS